MRISEAEHHQSSSLQSSESLYSRDLKEIEYFPYVLIITSIYLSIHPSDLSTYLSIYR
jgi:hypothetical protein